MVDPVGVEPGSVPSSLEFTQGDGIRFLVEAFPRLQPETILVPALPLHLAVEWLKAMPHSGLHIRSIPVPASVAEGVPHHWPGGNGGLLVSHADFLCPEDCPEPEDGCTVTGEIRTPLYEILRNMDVPEFRTHVIQSRQLAPGLGGYTSGDLKGLLREVENGGTAKWLVGTACRCHGVVDGLDVTAG